MKRLLIEIGPRSGEFAARLTIVSLIIIQIGKCESKAFADVLLPSHENILTNEKTPLDLRVTRPNAMVEVLRFVTKSLTSTHLTFSFTD